MISVKEYEQLMEEREDREDLQAVREYEAAKTAGEKPIPLEQALEEIRRNRK